MSVAGYLVNALLLACFMLGSVSPFLPLGLAWRAAALAALAFLAGELISGPIAAPNISDAVGEAIKALFMMAIATAMAIRFAIAAALKYLTLESLGLFSDARPYRWVDYVLLAAIGGNAGFYITIKIASALGGSSGGYMLDISIAVAMGVMGVAIAFWRPKHVWLPVGAAFWVSASISFYGSWQTQRIIDGAEKLAEGRPWCLITPSGWRNRSPRIDDIGFFSLRKENDGAHLIALVRDKNNFVVADWSIRQQRFNKSTRGAYGSCFPQTTHSRALLENDIEDQVFAIGAYIFSVPTELSATATPEVLRISAVASEKNRVVLPRGFKDATLSFRDPTPRIPRLSKPLSTLSDFSELDVQTMLRGETITFSGMDPKSARHMVLSCLSGLFSERRCNVTATGTVETYTFSLPLNELKNWSEATDEIAALFDRLKVIEQ
ncbi:hypothetical protein [Neorhizobium sp. JUb45]|uniref:hypothetical protein n=1 Tax=unclassified Neorhizobium TaxID=2629175 RepID=UPI0010538FAE|nr:hypothetical protein [Neorhizobium sp. JUb45]TCR04159.1 hypothetical protein EDF70_102257 [Neorhizobium sp. JUb45]